MHALLLERSLLNILCMESNEVARRNLLYNEKVDEHGKKQSTKCPAPSLRPNVHQLQSPVYYYLVPLARIHSGVRSSQ